MATIAVCDARPVAFGFMRSDKRVYNFVTEGWDLIEGPASPSTAADLRPVHYTPLDRFSTDPRLMAVQFGYVPPVVSSQDGAWMVIYSLGDDGKIEEAIDVWPPPWIVKPLLKGGYSD